MEYNKSRILNVYSRTVDLHRMTSAFRISIFLGGYSGEESAKSVMQDMLKCIYPEKIRPISEEFDSFQIWISLPTVRFCKSCGRLFHWTNKMVSYIPKSNEPENNSSYQISDMHFEKMSNLWIFQETAWEFKRIFKEGSPEAIAKSYRIWEVNDWHDFGRVV